jgi:hypothetical protein
MKKGYFASRSDFERPICFDNMQENATGLENIP